MKTIQKRFLVFLFGCIVVRFLFVVIAAKVNKKYLPYLGMLSILPAIGFIYIYLGGYRKTGGETFGQKIWWNNLRPVHAILYLTFAYLAINKSSQSYKPLLIDVLVGLLSFLIYHYTIGSFSKLFAK
tara:strand:- start:368 stop:748 length:381 start_codon:yes stop_codon:yes gene_type:complete